MSLLLTGVGGGSSAPFDPLDLPSLEVFLDAMEISSLWQDSAFTTPVTANNDPVGGWQDLAMDHDHIQATVSLKGTYLTSGVNSLPAVSFNSDALEHLTGLFTIDACYGYVVLQSALINTVFQRIWSMKPVAGNDFDQNNGQVLIGGPSTGQTLRIISRNGAADSLLMANAYSVSTPYLFQWHRDGAGNATGQVAGVALSDTYTDGNDTPAWSCLGAQRYSGPIYQDVFRGRVGQVIFGTAALSAAQKAAVESYLVARWGFAA
jgi:hypothetical protein